MPPSVLVTKTQIPPLRVKRVTRPRLLEQLDSGLENGHRLTLVSAPAGYGKTTLVVDWLQRADQPVVWLNLDEGDNDPVRFTAALVAALQTVCERVGDGVLSLLSMPQLPAPEGLLSLLINDLASEQVTGLMLVLDDYHKIRSAWVHSGVQFLLDYAPQGIHLAVTTREDPPLSLARLRVREQLTELRAADLRFDGSEAEEFLNRVMSLGLTPEGIQALETRTEGWAAGLQLAGLSLKGREADGFISDFRGSHRYVIEYLVDEVLKRQPPELQDFLLKTSILDRLCAPLCEAVLDSGNASAADYSFLHSAAGMLPAAGTAQQVLQYLDSNNLFLVAMDANGEWYRYHHLFADFLRAAAPHDLLPELHRRAAAWFEANGYTAEAIQHWLAAGESQPAAQLIARKGGELLHAGEMNTLLGWIDALPEEVVLDSSELVAFKAMSMIATGHSQHALEFASRANQVSQEASGLGRGRMLALQAWLAAVHNGSQLLALSQEALHLIGDQDPYFRTSALITSGYAYSAAGQMREGSRTFEEAYQLASRSGNLFMAMVALANLSFEWMDMGRLPEAKAALQDAIRQHSDRRGNPLPVVGVIYSPLSVILYQENDLQGAENYARKAIDLSQRLFSRAMLGGDSEVVLASILFARGEKEAAYQLLNDLLGLAESLRLAFISERMKTHEAILHLRDGDPAFARRWAELYFQPGKPSGRASARGREVLYANLLLSEGQVSEGLDLLEKNALAAQEHGCDGNRVDIGVLQARGLLLRGDRQAAVDKLKETVRLAAPRGMRRSFLDRLHWIGELLPDCRAEAPAFVDELLAAGGLNQSRPAQPAKANAPAAVAVDDLVEPIHERELDVLRLVAAGMSNQEVADELIIGVSTVKWHLNNVYGKLGVKSRTQAIARAKELNLIP